MQGFNMGRYVPPHLEGTASGNQLHKKRAPGMLKNGAQTVRFEMPFAVWCHTCKPHGIIGQGVRFNAEKRKVGSYYSTPMWSFVMRHPACNGAIEIRTDPKNTAYVVVAGGKAREYGDLHDRVREGEDDVPILTAEEREQRREDAFAQLEGKVEEKQQTQNNAKRIRELYQAGERDWEDPWNANKRMRETFRHDRKVLKRKEVADQHIKDRLGTDIDLLPETEEDGIRAKLISYGDDSSDSRTDAASIKPVFAVKNDKTIKKTKASTKDTLRDRLIANTRAMTNPFG